MCAVYLPILLTASHICSSIYHMTFQDTVLIEFRLSLIPGINTRIRLRSFHLHHRIQRFHSIRLSTGSHFPRLISILLVSALALC